MKANVQIISTQLEFLLRPRAFEHGKQLKGANVHASPHSDGLEICFDSALNLKRDYQPPTLSFLGFTGLFQRSLKSSQAQIHSGVQ